MAGYIVERLPNEPIVLASYQPDWDTHRDTDPALEAVEKLLSAAHSPLFYIVDMTIEPHFNLDDLMFVTQRLFRGQHPIFLHPNLREHLLVTHNPIMRRAVTMMPQGVKTQAFDTVEEALAYVRSRA